VITPFAGIAARGAAASPRVTVTYNSGSSSSSAAVAARAASVAIVFADLPESEGGDLPNINLTGQQNQLISAVAAANPRTIVVLNTGSAVAMPWLSSVAGVLEAWYPGQDDGRAIASVLFGDVDPGGKLPVTFPASLSQVPASSPGQWPGLGSQRFSEGIFVGYRYYQAHHETPLFPFGFGLSYTHFRIGRARRTGPSSSGRMRVSVRVTNTGRRTGSDVVQLYVGDPRADGEPPRQLEAFRRVTLRPGRSARVRFMLGSRALSFWDGVWVARHGSYQLYVGDSSASLPVHLHFRLRRTIDTGNPVGPPPHIGSDSPTVTTQCLKDTLAPAIASWLTLVGDGQNDLAALP
jgi:beta-glucosidase